MCPIKLPSYKLPQEKGTSLERLFPGRVSLVSEASRFRKHKGWTVVEAVASCPDPA